MPAGPEKNSSRFDEPSRFRELKSPIPRTGKGKKFRFSSSGKGAEKTVLLLGAVVLGMAVLVLLSGFLPLPGFMETYTGPENGKITEPVDSIEPEKEGIPDIKVTGENHSFVSGLGCSFNPARGASICEIPVSHPDQFLDVQVTARNNGTAPGSVVPSVFLFRSDAGTTYAPVEIILENYLSAEGIPLSPGEARVFRVVFQVPIAVQTGALVYETETLYDIRPLPALGTVVLNQYELFLGDTVMASFTPAENSTMYVTGPCGSPWGVERKNAATLWEPYPGWQLTPGECKEECENNVLRPPSPSCGEECTGEGTCIAWNPETGNGASWDLKNRAGRAGMCGTETGDFVFVGPAPTGQYKFTFTYFDTPSCDRERVAERIFSIKKP